MSPNTLRYLSEHKIIDSAGNSLPDYYDPGIDRETIASVIGVPSSAIAAGAMRELAALYYIYLYGMRAGEYLSIAVRDLIGNDMCVVHGEKGGSSYQIRLPGIDEQFAGARLICPGRLVSGTTYRRVYTLCVRCSIGILPSRHINVARTHAGRYNLVARVDSLGERVAGDLLHHRSRKTVNSYRGAGGR